MARVNRVRRGGECIALRRQCFSAGQLEAVPWAVYRVRRIYQSRILYSGTGRMRTLKGHVPGDSSFRSRSRPMNDKIKSKNPKPRKVAVIRVFLPGERALASLKNTRSPLSAPKGKLKTPVIWGESSASETVRNRLAPSPKAANPSNSLCCG